MKTKIFHGKVFMFGLMKIFCFPAGNSDQNFFLKTDFLKRNFNNGITLFPPRCEKPGVAFSFSAN